MNTGARDLSGMCVAGAAHLLEFHCVVANAPRRHDCSSTHMASQHSHSILLRSQHSLKIPKSSNTWWSEITQQLSLGDCFQCGSFWCCFPSTLTTAESKSPGTTEPEQQKWNTRLMFCSSPACATLQYFVLCSLSLWGKDRIHLFQKIKDRR